MQVTIKVTCFSCGNKFDHYLNLRESDDDPLKCPYCRLEIDRHAKKQILSAANGYRDALEELYKYADGYNLPLFQFDLVTTYADPRKI